MRHTFSRRTLLHALGTAAVMAPASAFAQGRCMRTFGAPDCNTSPIPPVFAATGWKTTALESVSFKVADYQKEAAFYSALMGWKLRSDNGKQAVMDIPDWGSVIFRQVPAESFPAPAPGRNGRTGDPVRAVVESFAFVIEPWNLKTVEAELEKRGLNPVADHDGGVERFRLKDPDGFELQICNGNGLAKARRMSAANAKLAVALPFESTGWKTVWLDHFSFGATNYKRSASFYSNLLGWKETYDEGSQNELLIGEIGDIIIRGGNPLAPNFTAGGPSARRVGIDHISFGIQPWDTDGVKAELEKRGWVATIDTSTGDEIHVAPFKSYHTRTPNGYNLQISYVTHDNRLALPNAVRPETFKKRSSGRR